MGRHGDRAGSTGKIPQPGRDPFLVFSVGAGTVERGAKVLLELTAASEQNRSCGFAAVPSKAGLPASVQRRLP